MAHQINISDKTYNAIAAKHGDVDAFIERAAKQALDFDLAESLALIRESEADIAAGRTTEMRQDLQEIAAEFGLTITR